MEFGVLGPLQVRGRTRDIPVTAPMQRMLLGILLCSANVRVPAEVLIHQLWGGDPDRAALGRLQLLVHKLRRALGDPDRICFQHSGYLVRVAPGELDAEVFDGLLDRAGHVRHPAARVEVIRAALALWRGEPYADVADVPLVGDEIRRLDDRRLTGLEDLYEAELACGRHGVVVSELTVVAERHPFRERMQGLVMTALFRAGRVVEALEVYERTRTAMVEEFGLEPGPELADLHGRILGNDRALLRSDATSVPDLVRRPSPCTSGVRPGV